MTNQMLLAAIQPDEQIYFITSKVDGLDGVVVRREEVVHVPFWTYISNNAGAVTRLKGNDFLDVLWDGGQAIKSDEWNEKFINRTNPFTKDDLKSVANLLLDVPKERKQEVQQDLSEFEKKSLDGDMSFKSPRSPLKMEPYDPDARDGDNDGIVQENTPWERPAATRLMDAAGKLIERGKESGSRPSGIRVVDADGNDVDYTPTYERSRAGTIGAGRQLGGSTSKPDVKPEPKKPVVGKPTQEKPEVKPKKPGSGTALSDHGSGSLKERGLRDVRAAAAPPPPPEPPKPEPKKPDAPKAQTYVSAKVDSDSPEKLIASWKDDIQGIHEKIPSGEWDYKTGDRAALAISKKQGFDGLPQVVPADEWQDFVKTSDGHTFIFRGMADPKASSGLDVSGADMATQFRSGDHYVGFGIFGNGYYSSNYRPTAEHYANEVFGTGGLGKVDGGAVLDMALVPDAKIIKYDDLERLMSDPKGTLQQALQLLEGEDKEAFRRIILDPGRAAQILGYDAIQVPNAETMTPDSRDIPESETHYVVLNRTAIAVKDHSDSQTSRTATVLKPPKLPSSDDDW